MLKYLIFATLVLGASAGMVAASVLVATGYADVFRLLDIGCFLSMMSIVSVGIGVFGEIRKAGY